MSKVVGVRFREAGKSYHFDPVGFVLHQGDYVIVETVKGVEIGTVSDEIIDMPDEMLHQPVKPILRLASEADMDKMRDNKVKEKSAFDICAEKIAQRGLDMSLVDVEYSFDGTKVIFYFTADGRVDFRELVKDLAGVFRLRIELRQIGVRDEAKMVGGLGICGRELCCSSFLNEFMPVSIKMAKEQNLSMNPAKISGACGRLLCCLKYEQDAYEDAHARMPRTGTVVNTRQGRGVVDGINLLRETVTVRLDNGDVADLQTYKLEDITFNRPESKKSPCGGKCPAKGGEEGGGCCKSAVTAEDEEVVYKEE
jgi:cell fate regulator YaaT (PSP1 superfamily)